MQIVDNQVYVEGGIILLKLQKQRTLHQYHCDIKIKYTSNDGVDNVKTYPLGFDHFDTQGEYYSDQKSKMPYAIIIMSSIADNL